MFKNLIFCLLFFIPLFASSQSNNCACCTPEHSQFDFWIGEWDVYSDKGEKLGENFIEKLEDNCIVSENWKSVKAGTGKSYNYFDPSDNTWNQLWISNTGTILKLKGVGSAGEMRYNSGRKRPVL